MNGNLIFRILKKFPYFLPSFLFLLLLFQQSFNQNQFQLKIDPFHAKKERFILLADVSSVLPFANQKSSKKILKFVPHIFQRIYYLLEILS